MTLTPGEIWRHDLRTLLAFASFGATAIAAPVPKEAKIEDKSEGTWQIESTNANGRSGPIPGKDQYWSIDENAHV